MKKVFLFIVLVTVALASFSQKKYENSYVSVIVPNGWVVQNDGDKGMGTELMYFYNDEYDANIYNLGMIIGFNQFQKPEFMLETQMNLKSNPLFENADFGGISYTEYVKYLNCKDGTVYKYTFSL